MQVGKIVNVYQEPFLLAGRLMENPPTGLMESGWMAERVSTFPGQSSG